LEAGVNVNTADINNRAPPISLAVKTGNLQMIELLLEFGAKINIYDGEYHEPLLITACESNQPSVVKLLIKYGADVNLTCDKGLYFRCNYKYKHYPISRGRHKEAIS